MVAINRLVLTSRDGHIATVERNATGEVNVLIQLADNPAPPLAITLTDAEAAKMSAALVAV